MKGQTNSPYIHLTRAGRLLVAAGFVILLLTAGASDAGNISALQTIGMIAAGISAVSIGITLRARERNEDHARAKKERPDCGNSQRRKR